MLLYRVTEAFKKQRLAYAIAGGWAVALHGAVRGTVDIDVVLVLSEECFSRAEKALHSIGLHSRLPVSAKDVIEFREEFIRNRKMLAWRFANPSDPTEIVDILMTDNLEDLKTKHKKVGTRSIPLVAIEDLIRMKQTSGRPQDLEDIKALESLSK